MFFGDRDDSDDEGPEAGWYVACLQLGDKNIFEQRRQLISAVLQGGGRDRDWSSRFAGDVTRV